MKYQFTVCDPAQNTLCDDRAVDILAAMKVNLQMSAWQERARRSLAGGVSSQFRAADPVVFSRGRGSRIWDVDDNEYIDFTLSQGPLIHGHSHPEILAAVAESLGRGQVWNGLHTQEIELAEKIIAAVPCAERVRLACTGSEAVHAAIRAARVLTGRPRIVKFEGHYHGWYDGVAISINPPLGDAGPDDAPLGVPWSHGLAPNSAAAVIVLPWNDPATLDRTLDRHSAEIAAVITEPVMCNTGCIEPQRGFLEHLRAAADRYGFVLIFDEVITGFRLALGGAQAYYHVTPDLAIFGKALAAGFPLSVIAGREQFMQPITDGRAIHAGTLNAHVGAVAASLASIRLLEADNRSAYALLHRLGDRLQVGLAELAGQAGHAMRTTGPGPVFHAGFIRADQRAPATLPAPRHYRDAVRMYDSEMYAQFVRAMAQRGVRLIGRGIWYLSTAHTDRDVDQTIDAARGALAEIGQTRSAPD
jgi:glutamate-1-semialdehyde 2,1-aminomutase